MKVFYTKPTCEYSGGIVLVAANSPDEALIIAASNPDIDYYFLDRDGNPSLDSSYAEWAPFSQLVGVECDTTQPKVLVSDVYAE